MSDDLILKLNEVTVDKEQQNGQYDELFEEIAELLMKSYQIVNGTDRFWIEEVEFYYCTPHSNDFRKQTPEEVGKPKRHITYPRTCEAGKWFFHDSGMDLTFKSDEAKGYGGGILIRSVRKERCDKTIQGPQNSYWTVFGDYSDAFSDMTSNPHLEKVVERKGYIVDPVPRVGIDEEVVRNWNFKFKKKK